MVDSEKLSLCCSDEGRYLLLGVGGDGGGRGDKKRKNISEIKTGRFVEIQKQDTQGEGKCRSCRRH